MPQDVSIILLAAVISGLLAFVYAAALLVRLRDWRIVSVVALAAIAATHEFPKLLPIFTGAPYSLKWSFESAPDLLASIAIILVLVLVARQDRSRRDATDALDESEAKFRNLVEGSPQGIIILDAAWSPLFVNPAALQVLGFGDLPRMLDAGPIDGLLAVRQHARADRDDGSGAGGKPPLQYETQTQRPDGETIWLQVRVRSVSWSHQPAIQVSVTDITERKKSEAEAQASERRLSDFAEAAADWIWEMDGELRFSYLSEQFTEVTGTAASELLGKTIEEIGRANSGDPDWRNRLADLAAHRLFRAFRLRYGGREGHSHYWSLSGKPVFDEAGEFKGYRGTGTDVAGAIQTRERAERAELYLRQAIETISEGFALYDRQDRLVLCNSKYREIYADSAEAIVPGNTFESILRYGLERGQYEEAVGRKENWLEERLQAHLSLSAPIEQKLRDGRWLLIEERRMSDGSTVGIRTDITQLKQAEDALRQSEARLSRAQTQLVEAIEAMHEGFALYDADDRLVLCNSVYSQIYANSVEAIVPGNSFEEILRFGLARGQYQEAIGREEEWLQERLQAHRRIRPPFEQSLGDGRWLRITERRTKEGGIVGIRTDITELKTREQELAQQSSILQLTLDNMVQGISMIDKSLALTAFNQRAVELLELPDELCVPGTSLEAIFRYNAERGEYGPGDVDQLVAERIALARKFEPHRFERARPDGTVIEVSGTPIPGGGFVTTYTDITESKRREVELWTAKEQAELANRSKTEFLANMSHELRTPLTAINGFAEVLEGELFGPLGHQKYKQYVTDIRESGEHLLQIINDILDVSKIEAGELELHEEAATVTDLIQSTLRLVRERADGNNQRLVTDIKQPMTLYADPRLVKQILVNLLSNAVKFTPPGGCITVRADGDADGGLMISVEDTGIGIANHDIPEVLTPFRQADGTLARTHEGTGLGLPLAKSLTELHGGWLEIKSELKVGTAVTVHFPPERRLKLRATG